MGRRYRAGSRYPSHEHLQAGEEMSDELGAGGGPAVRQQVIELLDRTLSYPREHVLEPGERVHVRHSQEATKLRSTAIVLPPRSLPTKVQLFRPTAIPRNDRSVWLLSIDRAPSSR